MIFLTFLPPTSALPRGPGWARSCTYIPTLQRHYFSGDDRGLAREMELQRGAEDRLLFRERRQYLRAIQDALAGADAARVVLAGVVRRLEGG